jgi:mercuric ion transport protein
MFWQKIRSSAMFVISFVTCPCHLPITLPLALVLLAGTPAAIWVTQHTNWIYGGMIILFLVSLALGFRWMSQPATECEPRSVITINKTTTQTEGVKHE